MIASVTLHCESNSKHLNQIYAGFALLHRSGVLRVRLVRERTYRPGLMAPKYLTADVAGMRVVYDTRDTDDVHPARLAGSDLYFKRSLNQASRTLPNGDRLRPLGLNYSVYAPHDWALRRWVWSLSGVRSAGDALHATQQGIHASALLSRLAGFGAGRTNTDVRRLHACPHDGDGALFLTRVWEPRRYEDDHALNEMRAGCVRRLREALGSRFTGGFQATPYAIKHYPDCVVPDALTRKGAYLQAVREAAVCVATTGLLGSTGWKFGEYVALTKAIVSEPPVYEVPGDFVSGRNYVPFRTPDECAAAVLALLGNPTRRRAMQAANYSYYHRWLRPDVLVMRTVLAAVTSTTLSDM